MRAVRALQNRVVRIERAAMPQPSPFVLAYGSFDQFVEGHVLPGIEAGALDLDDMVDVVAALRGWQVSGLWEQARRLSD